MDNQVENDQINRTLSALLTEEGRSNPEVTLIDRMGVPFTVNAGFLHHCISLIWEKAPQQRNAYETFLRIFESLFGDIKLPRPNPYAADPEERKDFYFAQVKVIDDKAEGVFQFTKVDHTGKHYGEIEEYTFESIPDTRQRIKAMSYVLTHSTSTKVDSSLGMSDWGFKCNEALKEMSFADLHVGDSIERTAKIAALIATFGISPKPPEFGEPDPVREDPPIVPEVENEPKFDVL